MLNPECVDVEKDDVKICFSDDNADMVLELKLGKREGFALGKMLTQKLNKEENLDLLKEIENES